LRGIELGGARLTLWAGMALSSGASAVSLMTSKFDAVDLPFGNVSKGSILLKNSLRVFGRKIVAL